MFEVNDYVVCVGNGVCEVQEVCSNPFDTSKPEEKYYILKPVYSKENTVYIPIEHPKIAMRKVISKKEAEKLIENIPCIGTIWIENDKERELKFKETLKNLDCYELVKMIKTLYLRNEERTQQGKRATSTDQKYFKLAEKTLHEELAVVLEMNQEEIGAYIVQQVEQSEDDD